MRKLALAVFALAIVVCTGQTADAQMKGMGRLNGTVVDERGSVISGVVIKLHQGTDTIEGKSDDKGEWVLSGVARGNWNVSFDKEGFPTKIVKVLVEKELLRTEPIKIQLKKGA